MGNQLVGATPGQILSVENYLNELPDSFKSANFSGLGSTRFFKVARISHGEGSLVVKVLVKPDGGSLQLRQYRDTLQEIRDLLVSSTHCLPFHSFHETERAAVLLRQHIRYNLYDRISTRPFLNPVEKLWIVYQLLYAVKEAHANGVCHGDIKTENVLVASWNWVALADFASYKPTYLPDDNPSYYSFFFDTSRRRVCYIAPERFVQINSGGHEEAAATVASSQSQHSASVVLVGVGGVEIAGGRDIPAAATPVIPANVTATRYSSTPPSAAQVAINPSVNGDLSVSFVAGKEPKSSAPHDKTDSPLTKEMDIFSVGCVAAELFCDGTPLFDLSELLAYRNGLYDPEKKLNGIENKQVVSMIREMISLDPSKRPGAHELLSKYKGIAFPLEFSTFLTIYTRRFCGEPILTADDRIARLRRDMSSVILARLVPDAVAKMQPEGASPLPAVSSPTSFVLPADEVGEPTAGVQGVGDSPAAAAASAASWTQAVVDPGSSPQKLPPAGSSGGAPSSVYIGGKECLVIITSILTSSIRHCSTFHGKLTGLDLLTVLARHSSDAIVLERLVPFMTHMLTDESPQVQATAIRALAITTKQIKEVPRSDTNVFPEYILPALHPLTSSDLIVRVSLAENIVTIAKTAQRILELTQIIDDDGTLAQHTKQAALHYQGSFDAERLVLHDMIQKLVVALLCDPVNTVKRTLLENDIAGLCVFFGLQKANDVLLSHMITFQNDKLDSQLRGAFFDNIVTVASYVGAGSLFMVMPLLQQGLGDLEETVIHKALEALTCLCSLGLFHKYPLHELSLDVLPFLCHASKWLRSAAVGFITSMARILSVADLYCMLLPNLNKYLDTPIVQATDEVVVQAMLKPPLKRSVYDNLTQYPQLDEFFAWLERRSSKRRVSKPHLNYTPASMSPGLQTLLNKINPLSDSDEEQIWTMKDYIMRMQRTRASVPDMKDEVDGGRPGRVGSQNRHLLRIASVKNPPNDEHFPLSVSALSLQTQQRSGSSKKTPVTGENPSMSDEWNQMFGTTRGKEQGGAADKSASLRRNEARKPALRLRTESTAVGKSASSRQRHPSLRTAGRSATTGQLDSAGEGVASAAAVSSAKSPASSAQPGSPSGRAAVSAANSPSPSGAAAAQPAYKQPQFVEPDSGRSANRTAFENRSRVCRQDVTKLLWHRYEQNRNRVVFTEEMAAVKDFQSRMSSAQGWVPAGVLIAHMREHRSAINQIVVAEDNTLFATGSDDSTVRIWDCARLMGRSVVPHRSVASYSKHAGRVQCLVFLDPTHLASASTDGSLHVVSLAGEQRMSAIRQASPPLGLDKKDHVLTLQRMHNGNVVVCTTLHGHINAYDLRARRPAWTLQNPLRHGLITCAAKDHMDCWLAVGTTTGTHVCWDLRFRLPVSTWKHPAFGVEQLCPHPTKQSRLISSVGANNEVSVWDMETGNRSIVFCSGVPLSKQRTSNYFIRSLATHSSLGGNAVLLGGSDRRVRLFNMAHPLESSMLVPPKSELALPPRPNQSGATAKYRKHQTDGTTVVQEQLIETKLDSTQLADDQKLRGPHPPASGHLDAITGVAVTNVGQNYLLTASRDGVVKVWK